MNNNDEEKIEDLFDKSQDDSLESDVIFENSTENGEALPEKDKSKKLREELKICQKEKEEYLVGWQRAKADYVNLQKELDQVRVNSSVLTKESVMRELLPVLDSFDMAFVNKEAWERVDKEWRVGIEYIHQQFISSLANFGVEKIDSEGVSFDPKIHHSIKMVETNLKDKDHTVAEIIQAGYKIGDRIIRPARVNVYEFTKE